MSEGKVSQRKVRMGHQIAWVSPHAWDIKKPAENSVWKVGME